MTIFLLTPECNLPLVLRNVVAARLNSTVIKPMKTSEKEGGAADLTDNLWSFWRVLLVACA